jgi:hypothetical protein
MAQSSTRVIGITTRSLFLLVLTGNLDSIAVSSPLDGHSRRLVASPQPDQRDNSFDAPALPSISGPFLPLKTDEIKAWSDSVETSNAVERGNHVEHMHAGCPLVKRSEQMTRAIIQKITPVLRQFDIKENTPTSYRFGYPSEGSMRPSSIKIYYHLPQDNNGNLRTFSVVIQLNKMSSKYRFFVTIQFVPEPSEAAKEF